MSQPTVCLVRAARLVLAIFAGAKDVQINALTNVKSYTLQVVNVTGNKTCSIMPMNFNQPSILSAVPVAKVPISRF